MKDTRVYLVQGKNCPFVRDVLSTGSYKLLVMVSNVALQTNKEDKNSRILVAFYRNKTCGFFSVASNNNMAKSFGNCFLKLPLTEIV